jgi:hypothetical protein
MPDTNVLSPPDDTYCLLRVPAADLGLLGFSACLKKYLRYHGVGCFAKADSLSARHSLPRTITRLSNDPRVIGRIYIGYVVRKGSNCISTSYVKFEMTFDWRYRNWR